MTVRRIGEPAQVEPESLSLLTHAGLMPGQRVRVRREAMHFDYRLLRVSTYLIYTLTRIVIYSIVHITIGYLRRINYSIFTI